MTISDERLKQLRNRWAAGNHIPGYEPGDVAATARDIRELLDEEIERRKNLKVATVELEEIK